MRKIFSILLLLLLVSILYLSAVQFSKIKKNARLRDESFIRADDHKYSADIIESIHSDIPGDPQIKVRFANIDEDEDEATISIDTESESEQEEEEDLPIKKKKLPKSKLEDIHSFL
ncbi:unnamed protein product [Rotaria sordida]|uniref:Uncharacterized protein n=1 Tax=Rotaria sordida TaxID=392033 RepID=A0A814IWX9_9BILA|nr:unnamed protein product [Rotaria sordida]CAF1029393.1 unnamed protein product [Rotaria sordida]CAF1159264.1 unnamed protein product [Rotaria sordida]